MKKRKNTATGKLESELVAAQERILARMRELQRKLAKHEILRAEHRHREDELDERMLLVSLALAALRLDSEIEGTLNERPEPISESGRKKLAAILEEKSRGMREIEDERKIILGEKPDSRLLRRLKETYGWLLEAQAEIKKISEEDAQDRLAQASILGGLEEALHRHRKAEAYRNAAIEVADELVIDVPRSLAREKGHEGLRRESRSRLAKR